MTGKRGEALIKSLASVQVWNIPKGTAFSKTVSGHAPEKVFPAFAGLSGSEEKNVIGSSSRVSITSAVDSPTFFPLSHGVFIKKSIQWTSKKEVTHGPRIGRGTACHYSSVPLDTGVLSKRGYTPLKTSKVKRDKIAENRATKPPGRVKKSR